ncbi:cytochrome c maturation protein CcmE [Yoonia sp. I 8.24]|uniref:cytochrome c maturation protein CcmE n=1 Tax=Yoonia sp. I 8.24 TaxID=1537229 RepID=UPI001EDFB672|nr:cytochrome c maturation protein CcmE [Yoonia sp. I 8.24]MCG3267529.1 cytochrome c maturation protein CcmE [Yoonia sp. I 8.24]
MSGLKNLKKRRRIQVIGIAGACVGAILTALWFLPEDSFQYFRSPSEVAAAPPAPNELFRIGGLVETGSLVRGQGQEITFAVTDGGAVINVAYNGILPDLFAEGQGVVGQGRYINGTFEAVEILAKHDETYMPKEVIDALKDQGTYVAPDGADATH